MAGAASPALKLKHRFVLLLVAALICPAASAQTPAERQRRVPEKTPSPETGQPASPRDELDRIRSLASEQERIGLLERFLASNRGTPLESEAREMLMREYALRGEQHLREGAPRLAIEDFRSVFRAAPAEITDRIFSQYIFPMPVAMSAFGYRVESVDLMRSFESRFENDPNRIIQIGFFYVQIEAPLEAVRVLEKAVQLAPQDHRAHNSLGTAYLINLRVDDAEAEFRRALELDARDEYANLNLANLLRAHGDHQRAVAYYQAQLKLRPDDAEAHGGLAISLLALGRDEDAEKEIARATELGPDDYRLFTEMAYFYATRKKTVLARDLVERAARIEQRYAWAHIAKANIDSLEGKYGDALSTLILAQQLGKFPTLSFELAKAFMSVDGYDQAIEVMGNAFTVTENGEFEANLGGVMKARSPRIDLLLDRERQAALFLNDQTTTTLQYRLAEALFRIDYFSKMAIAARPQTRRGKSSSGRNAPPLRSAAGASRAVRAAPGGPGRGVSGKGRKPVTLANSPAAGASDQQPAVGARPGGARTPTGASRAELSAGPDAALPGVTEMLRAIKTFTALDDGRQPFRMLWVAKKLTSEGLALDAAVQLALRAIQMADAATEPERSMRDAPLLDREGRKQVFLGRAEDLLGWALLKRGDARGAIGHLTRSVDVYPPNAERKGALWHLAVATEEAGDEPGALEYYIDGFEPNSPTSSIRRAHIEELYKKVKGSLDGLEDRLRQP